MLHQPVLLNEAIEFLKPKKNQNFVDCTLGAGGHAKKILEMTSPSGKILGIDLSNEVIAEMEGLKNRDQEFKDRLVLVRDNFGHLSQIIKSNFPYPIGGILIDLGLSSDLLESSNRGFTFQKTEKLDMRLDSAADTRTAADILNQSSEEELRQIFRQFGEERYAAQIAKYIIQVRRREKIENTTQLVQILQRATGKKFNRKIVARVFQALRIAVNNELDNLSNVLVQVEKVLSPGSRLVVISYHSLEDRIVKYFLKNNSSWRLINKKVIKPTREEIKNNRRARSAKLRAAEKI